MPSGHRVQGAGRWAEQIDQKGGWRHAKEGCLRVRKTSGKNAGSYRGKPVQQLALGRNEQQDQRRIRAGPCSAFYKLLTFSVLSTSGLATAPLPLSTSPHRSRKEGSHDSQTMLANRRSGRRHPTADKPARSTQRLCFSCPDPSAPSATVYSNCKSHSVLYCHHSPNKTLFPAPPPDTLAAVLLLLAHVRGASNHVPRQPTTSSHCLHGHRPDALHLVRRPAPQCQRASAEVKRRRSHAASRRHVRPLRPTAQHFCATPT